MNSKARPLALIGLSGLLLSGCAAGGSSTGLGLKRPDNWGEANRQTFAAMVVNPNPEYDDPIAASSGEAAAQAIERLRTGKLKMPERQNVSTIGSAGKSGSGGN